MKATSTDVALSERVRGSHERLSRNPASEGDHEKKGAICGTTD